MNTKHGVNQYALCFIFFFLLLLFAQTFFFEIGLRCVVHPFTHSNTPNPKQSKIKKKKKIFFLLLVKMKLESKTNRSNQFFKPTSI